MKQVKNVLTLVVLLIALSARADGERVNLLFNFDWKFKLGEVQNAESPAFDDADWRRLDLPHDFQVEMPWNEKANRAPLSITSTAFFLKASSTTWNLKLFAMSNLFCACKITKSRVKFKRKTSFSFEFPRRSNFSTFVAKLRKVERNAKEDLFFFAFPRHGSFVR